MANSKFAEALLGQEEVQITFLKSKNKKMRSLPIWFTVEGSRVQLLPMYGLKTKWFQDIEKSGSVELEVRGLKLQAKPKIIRDEVRVDAIKAGFGTKYGAGDVKRYYPTSEVALEITT